MRSELKKLLKLLGCYLPVARFRRRLFQLVGYEIHDEVYIAQGLIVVDSLRASEVRLRIDKMVTIAPRVTIILDSGHNFQYNERSPKFGDVVIESGAFIGAHAVIFPGVRIGRGAVVGAGAVVTKDVENDITVVGVPAKPLRRNRKDIVEKAE